MNLPEAVDFQSCGPGCLIHPAKKLVKPEEEIVCPCWLLMLWSARDECAEPGELLDDLLVHGHLSFANF